MRLFKLVFNHYDEVAYRLLQLHRCKEQYDLGNIVKRATEVSQALNQLHQLAQESDALVVALEEEFKQALRRLATGCMSEANAAQRQAVTHLSESAELVTATVYQPSNDEATNRPHPFLSKSFSAAEEEVAHRGHARTATVCEAQYAMAGKSADLVQPRVAQPYQGAAIGTRRKGNVPRIFTGSFSQLESDLRKLQLDKIRTHEGQINPKGLNSVKFRDFGAATPHISPCTTPSSATLLQRRDALVSRDSEFQNRVINGDVVKSRRPSTKPRAQTIDDRTGGLEAWQKEESSEPRLPDMPNSAVRRGYLRHRENTL